MTNIQKFWRIIAEFDSRERERERVTNQEPELKHEV
jgi:hypothetical protein